MFLDWPNTDFLFRVGNDSQLEVKRMTLRGFYRGEVHFSAATQQDILKQAGVKTIFHEFQDILDASRKGDMIAVAGLRAFGTNHHEIAAVIDALHAKGVIAVDAATGRDTHKDGVRLLSEAIIALANERRGGSRKASEFGKKGAEASAKSRRKGWMPWNDIRKVWFDMRLTRAEVLATINAPGYKPISYNTIHRHLGKRNAAAGRPPKQ